MATKIRETSILTGEDAELFLKKIKENESNRCSKEEIDIMISNYEKIKSISANPNCPICHGAGEYHTGGCFGWPVEYHRCNCAR